MRNERYYSNDGKTYATIVGRMDSGKTLFCVNYAGRPYDAMEAHEIKLYAWAKRLHGNAPAGTPYGYIRATRNGKRIIITV